MLLRPLRRAAPPGVVPSNYGVVRADKERIRTDVQYALQITKGYAASLPGGFAAIRGKAVLEIGPGLNLATGLILGCAGALRVVVTDRFLVKYQHSYHGPLYRALREALAQELPGADTGPLDECLASRSHAPGAIECVEMPLERFAERFAGEFDLVFSNAVLEHVYDPAVAAQSLFAIMRRGGRGYHQVDFRDHRDFARPLEYLLPDNASFQKLLEECHCECGNRIRPHELEEMFRRAGFPSPAFRPNMWADPGYLDGFLPRLRAASQSPYASIERAKLEVVSGQFELARPG
jgi:SAM-dependent methyltransferase